MRDEPALGLAETLLAEELTGSARRSVLATLDASAPPAPARGAPFAPGTVINGRYTVERMLGAGGMGIVYRVRDALDGERPLALKTLRGGSSRRAALSLFKSEFRTMTELRHPHLAQVYDFEPIRGSDDHLFTMDFIDGRDALAATGGATYRQILDLIVQACRALAYVHSRGIVHFDLKPDNVLVDTSGCVKIVDFGIAGSALAERDAIRGTPHYMAPELTGDRGQIDHRADLYALGIMTFELLFRRLPFDGATYVELLRQHHYEPIVLSAEEAASVPAWLPPIVQRLAAKHPDERFRTANDVIEAINRAGGTTYELETKETRESYALAGRFVGREAEAERLFAFVRARTAGEPTAYRAAMVAGQSGVGKSRLMRELRRLCQLQRLPFLEVDCHEHGADLAPIARALELALPLATTLGRRDLVDRFGPQLAKILPALAAEVAVAGVHPDPVRERAAVREAAAELLLALGDVTPFVLYVNDLQWAGEATTGVVRHLVYGGASGASSSRIAVLGTYRDDEVEGAPIGALLEDASDRIDTVHLAPLSDREVEVLIRSMLGVDRLPTSFVRLVARATGGSPFFVEELMRSLLEHGHVYRERGEWAASTQVSELPIPERMDDVLRRRASRLSAEQRLLLELVATHGKPLSSAILQAASGLCADTFFAALGVLRRRSMLRAVHGAQPAFGTAHDRIRETVYAELDEAARRSRHLRLAEAIEASDVVEGEARYDVAGHYRAAVTSGDPPELRRRAAEALAAAADEASRATLHEAARRYLEQALALLDGVDGAEALRARTRPRLLEVLYLVDVGEAEARLSEMLAEADVPEQAELHLVKGHALVARTDFAGAYEHALSAAARFGVRAPRYPSALVATLDYLRMRWAIRGVRPEAIVEWPEARDPRFRAGIDVLAVAGMAGSWLGLAANVSIATRIVRGMAKHGLVASAVTGLIGLALLTRALGDPERAWGFASAARAIAERAGMPGQTAATIAWGAAFAGVWCRPLPEVLRAVEHAYEVGRARLQSALLGSIANVWITMHVFVSETAAEWRALVGRHQALLASVGDAHALSEVRAIERTIVALRGEAASPLAIDDPSVSDEELRASIVHDAVAWSLIASFAARRAAIEGDWGRAEAEARASLAAARRSPLEQLFVAQSELLLFVARLRTGSWRRARISQWRLLRRYRRHARACPGTFAHGLALMEAEQARVRGRVDEAAAAYSRAIEGARRGGFRLDEALAEQLAAGFWASLGARDQASAHRERAASVYEAWGAHRIARELRTDGHARGAPHAGHRPSSAGYGAAQ